MYAPKFQSWITSEERFLMGLRAKIDRMGDEALAEIRLIGTAARARFADPDPDPPWMDEQSKAMRRLMDALAIAPSPPELQRTAAMQNVYGTNHGFMFGNNTHWTSLSGLMLSGPASWL